MHDRSSAIKEAITPRMLKTLHYKHLAGGLLLFVEPVRIPDTELRGEVKVEPISTLYRVRVPFRSNVFRPTNTECPFAHLGFFQTNK